MNTQSTTPRGVGPFFGMKRVAALLDVNLETVRRHIERGDLHSIKIGGRRLIAEDDLRAFIDNARRETEAARSETEQA